MPIDTIFLQSSINIDILNLESLPAACNICTEDQTNPESLLGLIIQCNSGVKRIEIKIRTSEGLFGEINVYLIPKEEDSNVSKAL